MNDPPRKRRTSVFAESENLGEAGLCLADQNQIGGAPGQRGALTGAGRQQIIYKHAISTIAPVRPGELEAAGAAVAGA